MRKEFATLFVAVLAMGCGGDGPTPTPAPLDIAPHSGQTNGGAVVNIAGAGFVGGSTVTFGGTRADSVHVYNGTLLAVMTPAHAAGRVDVVVTNPDGQTGSIAGAFVYADLAGSWTGTTSQSKAISFVVDATNAMTQLSCGYTIQGSGCTTGGILLGVGGSTDLSSLSFNHVATTESISGTFGSASSASGSLTVTSVSGCVGIVTATWNATKG